MKTIITLLSLAFIFSAHSAPSPAPVLDTHGKELRAGVRYFVLPTVGYNDHSKGLLGLAEIGNNSCPVGVAQNQDHGLTFTFTPVNPKKGVIRVSTDLNIKFAGSNNCQESNIWKLKYDKGMKQYAVMVGGVEGNPGPKTLDSWFKIEKGSYDGYKFVFCPSVCSYCKVMCRDLGIVVDEYGVQRLAFSDNPSSFGFF